MARIKKFNAVGTALGKAFPITIVASAPPTAANRLEIGQLWIDKVNFDLYSLNGYQNGSPQWVNAGGGSGSFASLTVTPGPTSITGLVNINTTAVAATTNIATGAAVQLLTLGSTNGLSQTAIRAGAAGFGITSSDVVAIDAGGVVALNSSGGTLNMGNLANAFGINIGTGAAARTIQIGGISANTIRIGDTQTGGSIAIGTALTTGTLTLGSGSAASTINGSLSFNPSISSPITFLSGTADANFTVGNTNMTGTISLQTLGQFNIIAGATNGISLGNLTAATSANILVGTGSPNTVVTAVQGSLFIRTNGTADTTLYVNTDGATAWTALTST